MATTENGIMALEALEDLRLVVEAETQDLYEQFGKYKKYSEQLEELEEWDNQDTTEFIGDIEGQVKKKELHLDSEYRLAVYVGRYPSLFHTLRDTNFTGSREESLKRRLEALKSIQVQVEEYLQVLVELE